MVPQLDPPVVRLNVISKTVGCRYGRLPIYNPGFLLPFLGPPWFWGLSAFDGLGKVVPDLFQIKISPALLFSGMYQKSFIYCCNRTNS